VSSYQLQRVEAHYSTGETASQAIRRATLVMEDVQKAGRTIEGGWLYTSALEGEPYGFVFLSQKS
jgi:hypothetical protein